MELEDSKIAARLGWTVSRQEHLEALGDPRLVAARVAVEHRGAYGLLGAAVTTGHLAGRLRHCAGPADAPIHPAVGDWVAVQPAPPGAAAAADRGIIHHVLPRTSLLARRRPGLRQEQVVAANVDLVFVVTALGRDLNPRRVERYLAAVWASGARPAIVLNKADVADHADDVEAALRALAAVAPGVTCLATSAASGVGLEALRAALPSGQTGAMVGSSGVGKSSLLNALLGEGRLATGTVRLTDDKGRHTTTRRELHELPTGGWMIDTPGMRELGLWDAGDGIEQTFADVEAVAGSCRFRDCQHRGEPGCAVAAAVERGELAEERLASLEKLRREEAFLERQGDPRREAATKGRWKVIHKQHRARQKVDPKLRED